MSRRRGIRRPLAVHADGDLGVLQHLDELDAGELRALVGIEDLRPTVAAIAVLTPPPETFQKARAFAAWVGLTPRQHSTGGKQRLGATTKMGERSLMLPELLDQIPLDQEIGSVTADGAYDTRKCHDAIQSANCVRQDTVHNPAADSFELRVNNPEKRVSFSA